LVRAFLTPDRPLGEELAPGVFEGELRYLRASEWALTLEDVLWRRSKLGLHLSPPQTQRLSQWWEAEDQRSGPAS
jgi:glycerol-3-phosphate dehydrogenase